MSNRSLESGFMWMMQTPKCFLGVCWLANRVVFSWRWDQSDFGLILPALRCLRTRYNFQINGCKLGFHTFGNHWERFPCLPWNNSSDQGHALSFTLSFSSTLQLNYKQQESMAPKILLIPPQRTKGKDLKLAVLTRDRLIAGVQLWFHGPHGVITLRIWGQPLGQQGPPQDAVTDGDRLAELSHKVLLRGQQHRVPGGNVQLAGCAPILLGENTFWKVCVERVQVRPMEEKLEGKEMKTHLALG